MAQTSPIVEDLASQMIAEEIDAELLGTHETGPEPKHAAEFHRLARMIRTMCPEHVLLPENRVPMLTEGQMIAQMSMAAYHGDGATMARIQARLELDDDEALELIQAFFNATAKHEEQS